MMKVYFSPSTAFIPEENNISLIYDGVAYFSDGRNKFNMVSNNEFVSYDLRPMPFAIKKGVCTWYDEYSGEVITSYGDYWHSNRKSHYYGIVQFNNAILVRHMIYDDFYVATNDFSPLYPVAIIDNSFFMKNPPFLPLHLSKYKKYEGVDFVASPFAGIIYDDLDDGFDVIQNGFVLGDNCREILLKEDYAYVSPVIIHNGIGMVRCEKSEIEECLKNPESYDVMLHFAVDGITKICRNHAVVDGKNVVFAGSKIIIVLKEGEVSVDVNKFHDIRDVIWEFGVSG